MSDLRQCQPLTPGMSAEPAYPPQDPETPSVDSLGTVRTLLSTVDGSPNGADPVQSRQPVPPDHRAGLGVTSSGKDDDPSISEWVTLAEAAQHWGLSVDTVRRRIKRGELSARQVATKHGPAYQVRLGSLPIHASAAAPRVVSTLDTPTVRVQGVVPTLVPGVEATVDGAPDATPSDSSPAMVEMVRLVSRLQEENRFMAGQLGFKEAQVLQLREQVRMLQAPSPETIDADDRADGETPTDTVVAMQDIERLKAELEEARRRASEAEVRREVQEGEITGRRPWWKFW